jgi:integrase
MLAIGLRPREALALRWQDIDLERHAVRITRTVKRIKGMWLFDEPKTKKSRRVVDYSASLNEVLLKHRLELSAFSEATELVFASLEGQPLHETDILKHNFR